MKINFYATLRPIVGGKTVEMPEAAGMTVSQVLGVLITRFPALKKEMFQPDGTLWPHVHFFINGRDAQYMDGGLSYVVQLDDTINIFPPVGGGAA